MHIYVSPPTPDQNLCTHLLCFFALECRLVCAWDMASAVMQANGGAWQVDSSGCTEGGSVSLELQGPFGSPDPGCLLDFQGNQADGVGIVM